ncbi:GTPase Era [bacterium]|nr:GTPase Era [bacterium]
MKSGFVNILGRPNVGKSTLMNTMLGEKLSIVTNKAQTTRHRIFGIVNREEAQIVFSDTPGIIRPAYALQERMMGFLKDAFDDADILLFLVEPGDIAHQDPDLLDRLARSETPLIVALNKIDTLDQYGLETLNQSWSTRLPKAEIVPISALKGFQTDYLLKRIIELLPEGNAYFDTDAMTDRSERFFASEILREKILLQYEQEIPYSCEVEIESFKEENALLSIRALIHVSRDSQKGILIGAQGKALNRLGTAARKEMERFFDKKVFLDLYVKVTKDWRENERILKRFGY